MSNTRIQIKRSTATEVPSDGSLNSGELAYSFLSNKLFTGNSAGSGVIEIGGKYWTDTTIAAFDRANAAPNIANSFAVYVGASSNHWANSILTNAQTIADSTYVKLIAPNQTITGNIAITGKLTVTGNAEFLDTETLRINDPLIYLAGNNYSSDVVDIGFIANYVNATGQNVHTGLFREHTNEEYYLFQGYNEEPYGNHIDVTSNGFTIAVLNADLKTDNLTLAGTNVRNWITSAFDKANGAVQTGFVTISASGTDIIADSNNDTLSLTSANGVVINGNATTDTIDISLSPTGVTAATYGGADRVGQFTVNQWGRITSASNVSITIDTSAITTGILGVPRGGTGVGTHTENGVLFGNGTSALKVTAAGTEGQVLQASSTGVPQFGMLDGGNF